MQRSFFYFFCSAQENVSKSFPKLQHKFSISKNYFEENISQSSETLSGLTFKASNIKVHLSDQYRGWVSVFEHIFN